jgi:chemotaxis protein histidine kinase CheA
MDLRLLKGTMDAAAIDGLLERLLFEAHSLTGAARAAGAEHVETVARRLENLFELLRKGELNPAPALCDVFAHALEAAGMLAREAIGDGRAGVDLTRSTQCLPMRLAASPRRRPPRRPHRRRRGCPPSPPARPCPSPEPRSKRC